MNSLKNNNTGKAALKTITEGQSEHPYFRDKSMILEIPKIISAIIVLGMLPRQIEIL
jgi:hypothetical protein